MRGIAIAILLLTTGGIGVTCDIVQLVWSPSDPNTDPMYPFSRHGKTGFIDRTGKIVIPPTFVFASEFHDGLVETRVADGVYADKTGKVVIGHRFYRGWDFSEGLAAAMDKFGGKWGYIDRTGTFVIPPQFESYPHGYVDSFHGGLAAIEVEGRTGFIDHSGKFVIQPQFVKAEHFSDGMARVVVEGPCVYVETTGCGEARFLGGKGGDRVPACKFSFVDSAGHVLTQRFDGAGAFSDGIAAVRAGGKSGFIEKSGAFAIEPQFDGAEAFSEGLAAVREGDRWGYIDRSGNIVITPQFAVAGEFSNGLAAVSDSDMLFRFIGKDGTTAFDGRFQAAGKFFKGLANVWYGREHAYVDTQGRVVFRY